MFCITNYKQVFKLIFLFTILIAGNTTNSANILYYNNLSKFNYVYFSNNIFQSKISTNKIEYKIQIGAFDKQVSTSQLSKKFNLIEKITEINQGNKYKYYVGSFDTYNDASDYCKKLKERNKIEKAFVVIFKENTKIETLNSNTNNNQNENKILKSDSVSSYSNKNIINTVSTINNNSESIFTNLHQFSTDTIKNHYNIDYICFEVDNLLKSEISKLIKSQQNIDTLLFKDLYSNKYDTATQNKIYDNFYSEKIKALKGDLGLKINGNYTENISPIIFAQEDFFYLRKATVGLDWDLLNSGLFENKSKINELKCDIAINKIKSGKTVKENNYIYQFNYIIYIFNQNKIVKLQRRIELLKKQLNILNQMYQLRLITWGDILAYKEKLVESESLLESYLLYNSGVKNNFPKIIFNDSINTDKLPIVEVNLSKIIGNQLSSVDDSLLTRFRIEKLENEYKPLNNISVRPFWRYNLYQNTENKLRNFHSVGLSVGFPLRKSNRVNLLNAQKQIYDKEQEINITGNENELLNYFYEYQSKIRSYIIFYYKLKAANEKLRKESVKNNLMDADFSPLYALDLLDDQQSLEFELLDIKQNLYLRLLKFQTYTSDANINKFTKIMNPELSSSKYSGNRRIYLWSEFFNENSNKQLVDYLELNEIKEVMLSPGNDIKSSKINDFLATCAYSNIFTDVLLGNNKWILNPESSKIETRINELLIYNFQGVHLDIEPHTLPDWKDNKILYLNNLIKLIEKAKVITDSHKIKLSVSIPVFYPDSILKIIYSLCDEVYIMAYEHNDVDYVARKISEELSINKDKTIIAIRTKDFTDRFEIEKFIDAIIIKTSNEKIAIHDLKTLFDLDFKTFKK